MFVIAEILHDELDALHKSNRVGYLALVLMMFQKGAMLKLKQLMVRTQTASCKGRDVPKRRNAASQTSNSTYPNCSIQYS
ncbi:hypothetical protein DPMN_182166 [Dreissena polymorpha]|uniref:Uncharacterized protein n=1 Tax=Dreissena polymorpha TaxID=45954 RepID=A0A9D4DDN6_DREPO|nr:hypothetical protein DPMN_182166 [Dreissena polymorpha]